MNGRRCRHLQRETTRDSKSSGMVHLRHWYSKHYGSSPICWTLHMEQELGAVKYPKPLLYVIDTNTILVNSRENFRRYSYAVVPHLNHHETPLPVRRNLNNPALNLWSKPVLDRIFHNRLQKHAGNLFFQSRFVDLLINLKLVTTKANDFY